MADTKTSALTELTAPVSGIQFAVNHAGTSKRLTFDNAIGNLLDNLFAVKDSADLTKVLNFQCSGIATATTRTWTWPDANDTVVGKATTDTFTNKSIDQDGTGNSITNIANASIKAAAAIALNKLAAITASRVPVADASGFFTASGVTATVLGYLDATSSIQTQIDGKISDITGDNLSALADATITGIASGELLKWNGSAWINNTLAEAGIQAALTDSDDITEGATNLFLTAAERTKVGNITITQAVDLDQLESDVAALDAAVVLQGTWDASAGTFPGSGAAQAGASWIVSVGGTVDSEVFVANDRIVAITDNASTATYAANWHKLDYTDQVLSVATLTGAITAANLRIQLGDIFPDLNTMGAAASDGEVMVATGAGAMAWESGGTLRTSAGLGTGNSPQFTGVEIGHASDTTLARSAAGIVTIEGTRLIRAGDNGDSEVSKINLKDIGEVTNAIGSIGGGTQDIDLTLGNSVTATVDTSTTTFTFSNPTAGDEACSFTLELTNGGSQTVNWPSATGSIVMWPGGTEPTLTAAGVDILTFMTVDGGAVWYGFAAGLDMQ